jgi:hypothetical protein
MAIDRLTRQVSVAGASQDEQAAVTTANYKKNTGQDEKEEI